MGVTTGLSLAKAGLAKRPGFNGIHPAQSPKFSVRLDSFRALCGVDPIEIGPFFFFFFRPEKLSSYVAVVVSRNRPKNISRFF
jgi:hypothetical protein